MKHSRPIPEPGGAVLAIKPLLLLTLLLLTLRYADAQPSPPSSDDSSSTNNNKNPYGFSPNFNPSMAIVIVVLISAFFFLGFFSIYIRQCGGGDRVASVRGGGGGGRSRRNRGLDPEVLAKFPTLVYSEVKGLKIGKGTLECAVCLSEFEDDETLRLLPRCSHVFHPDCIDAWLASHVTCPVCRSNLAALDPAETPDTLQTLAADFAREEPGRAPEEREDQRPAESTPPDHVVIAVNEGAGGDRKAELAELGRIGSRMRAAGSRSGARFPRSHSTGHSLALVHQGENLDRFTLRLPDHVRRDIVDAGKLQRAASMRAFPAGLEGSSRRGYRGRGPVGEGSSRGGRSIRLGRSDKWPSFLARTISARFSAFGRRWDGEGSVKKGEEEGSTKGKLSTVRPQFDCLGGIGGGAKSDVAAGNDESTTIALGRV